MTNLGSYLNYNYFKSKLKELLNVLFVLIYIYSQFPYSRPLSLSLTRLGRPAIFPTLKGHIHKIFIVCFKTFFASSISNRYKTQDSQHFRKSSSNSPRYSKFLITPSFHWKREALLSIVAKNAELTSALSS